MVVFIVVILMKMSSCDEGWKVEERGMKSGNPAGSVTTSSDPIVNSEYSNSNNKNSNKREYRIWWYLTVILKCKYIQFELYTINYRHKHHQAAEIYRRWFIYISPPCPSLCYHEHFPDTSQPISKYSYKHFQEIQPAPSSLKKQSEPSLQHTYQTQDLQTIT